MSLPSIVSVPMGSCPARRSVRMDRLMRVCWTSDLLSTGCRGISALLVVILPRLLLSVVVRVADLVSFFDVQVRCHTLTSLCSHGSNDHVRRRSKPSIPSCDFGVSLVAAVRRSCSDNRTISLTQDQHQIQKQLHPGEPISRSLECSWLPQHPMPTQFERDSIEDRDPADVPRWLQPSTLRLRRLLLRPLSRRRRHPRPPKQRMETRPLHQSPPPRRPQRLRRLCLQ